MFNSDDQHLSRDQNIPIASTFPIFFRLLRQFDSPWPHKDLGVIVMTDCGFIGRSAQKP